VAKYSVYYERKVQIRPYEMLTIGLTEEFNSEETEKDLAFLCVKDQVNLWIEKERARL